MACVAKPACGQPNWRAASCMPRAGPSHLDLVAISIYGQANPRSDSIRKAQSRAVSNICSLLAGPEAFIASPFCCCTSRSQQSAHGPLPVPAREGQARRTRRQRQASETPEMHRYDTRTVAKASTMHGFAARCRESSYVTSCKHSTRLCGTRLILCARHRPTV